MRGLHNLRTTRLVSSGGLKAALSGALAGVVLSAFIQFPPYLLASLGAVLGILADRWIAEMRTPDEEQGQIEYSVKESSLDEHIGSVISPIPEASEGLELTASRVYESLLRQARGYQQGHQQFVLFMAAASVASWEGADRKALDAIRLALLVEPTNLVAHFRMAETLEYFGSVKEAIAAYEEALQAAQPLSRALRAFISAQPQRVRVHGPKRRPAISGLRYMSY